MLRQCYIWRPDRGVWLYDPKIKSTFLDKSGHVLIMWCLASGFSVMYNKGTNSCHAQYVGITAVRRRVLCLQETYVTYIYHSWQVRWELLLRFSYRTKEFTNICPQTTWVVVWHNKIHHTWFGQKLCSLGSSVSLCYVCLRLYLEF